MNNKTTTGFGFCLKVSKMFWNFLMLSASVVNSNLDLNQITTKIIVSSPIFSSPPENITGFLTTTVFKVCKTLLYAIEISLMSSRMGLDLAPGLTLSFILSSTCRSINGYCWTVRQTWWKSGGGGGKGWRNRLWWISIPIRPHSSSSYFVLWEVNRDKPLFISEKV